MLTVTATEGLNEMGFRNRVSLILLVFFLNFLCLVLILVLICLLGCNAGRATIARGK